LNQKRRKEKEKPILLGFSSLLLMTKGKGGGEKKRRDCASKRRKGRKGKKLVKPSFHILPRKRERDNTFSESEKEIPEGEKGGGGLAFPSYLLSAREPRKIEEKKGKGRLGSCLRSFKRGREERKALPRRLRLIQERTLWEGNERGGEKREKKGKEDMLDVSAYFHWLTGEKKGKEL